MGEVYFFGYVVGVVNIMVCVIGVFFGQCCVMIVELQCYVYNVVFLFCQYCCYNRIVYVVGYCDNYMGFVGWFGKFKRIQFGIVWYCGFFRDDYLGSLMEYMKM